MPTERYLKLSEMFSQLGFMRTWLLEEMEKEKKKEQSWVPRSRCCNAKCIVKSGFEGTIYYACKDCGQEFLILDDMYHLSESEFLKLETGD